MFYIIILSLVTYLNYKYIQYMNSDKDKKKPYNYMLKYIDIIISILLTSIYYCIYLLKFETVTT